MSESGVKKLYVNELSRSIKYWSNATKSDSEILEIAEKVVDSIDFENVAFKHKGFIWLGKLIVESSNYHLKEKEEL